ncbi:hypothetical protein GCM10010976_28290 [Bizionia arctica]|uniref:Uncharacterized protein n=1 Tax=Bizionia arctica TaxID=1495645 RepID=A0A917LT23_9FLAO|nr:hypothetical protein GCM10010976_28290 [Bizionia arctica]
MINKDEVSPKNWNKKNSDKIRILTEFLNFYNEMFYRLKATVNVTLVYLESMEALLGNPELLNNLYSEDCFA